MKFILSYKMFESPDNIKINKDSYLDYRYANAKPFAYHPFTNELWIGEFKGRHIKHCPFLTKNGGDLGYDELKNDGRLWFGGYIDTDNSEEYVDNVNIISFWSIPEMDINNIINDLSKELNIDFNNWYLDIGEGEDKQNTIPITDIQKHKLKDFSEEKLRHLLTAQEKEIKMKKGEIKVPINSSSKKRYKHQPKKMNILNYKQLMKNVYNEKKTTI